MNFFNRPIVSSVLSRTTTLSVYHNLHRLSRTFFVFSKVFSKPLISSLYTQALNLPISYLVLRLVATTCLVYHLSSILSTPFLHIFSFFIFYLGNAKFSMYISIIVGAYLCVCPGGIGVCQWIILRITFNIFAKKERLQKPFFFDSF